MSESERQNQVREGDKVPWNWLESHPSDTSAEVKASEVTVVSHRGSEVSKASIESNPAVDILRPGNYVIKIGDELNVDEKPSPSSETNGTRNDTSEPKDEDKKKEKIGELRTEVKENETNEAQAGDKRKAYEKSDAKEVKKVEAEKDDDAKKQKTTNGKAAPTPAPTGEKKKPGRPKGGPKKEKKEPVVGKAERKTRSQGKV